MSVPKKRTSKTRRDQRRAHDFLVPRYGVICPNSSCGAPMLRHRVCPHCGQYRGRQVAAPANPAN